MTELELGLILTQRDVYVFDLWSDLVIINALKHITLNIWYDLDLSGLILCLTIQWPY